MNPVLQTIHDRYTCRSYTGEMPAGEQLTAIAEAAVQAPSAMNMQPWRVFIVKDAALMAEMEAEGLRAVAAMEDRSFYDRIQQRGGKLYYNAPCMAIVAIDGADPVRSALDCGILCQNIALAAASLGLGSCICGLAGLAFAGSKGPGFKEKLGFPAGYEFGMAVLLGHVAETREPHLPDLSKISFVG